MTDKIYKAGAYIRLSREDGNKFEESYSIANQRELIKQFLDKQDDITIYEFYSDDGKTGTNFDRPGFQKMMKDMFDKKIDCIIVKDLSRFGRNYIEVGRYIEYIFPNNNIRFISINDNIDNVKNPESIESIIVPFKNLMNDEYCRDISRKIKKVKEVQRLNGEITGSCPPYGYKIENKKYVIDENVKDIIKTIFDLSIAGESTTKIAFKLNEEKIDCPMVYFAKQKNKELKKKYHWSSSKINDILKNRVYCGDLVQGKTTTLNHKVKVSVLVPKDKWVIIENTHEAIIDRETFNKAQESIKSRTYAKKVQLNEFKTMFKGYLKCYDCHKSMVKKSCHRINNKNYLMFECYTYLRESHDYCTSKSINYDELYNSVLTQFKQDTLFLLDFENKMSNIITDNKELTEIKNNINEINNKINETNKLKNGVLLDLKKELISKSDYDFYSDSYDKALKELTKKLNDLKEKEFILTNDERIIKNFIKGFKKYIDINELREEILNELVDKIYVKSDKSVSIKYLDDDIFNLIKERSKSWEK